MKTTSVLALLLFLFLIPSVHAITIHQNVTFNTSATNTTYIAGANFTVDKITVTQTLLNITNSSTGDFIMSATPSSDSLNIIILRFNTSYKKFNISSNASGIIVNFVIGNITPVGTLIVFKKNGAYWNTITSNSSGYGNFTYSEGYSNIQFEALQDTTAPTVSLSLSTTPIYQGQSITITCSASDNYQLSTTSLTIAKPSGSTTASCNQPFTDTSAAGTYTVTYSATDTSGNIATASQSFTANQLGGSSKSSSSSGTQEIAQTIIATSSEAMEKVVVNLNAQIAGASVTIARMDSALASIPPMIEPVYQYLNITKNNFNNSQIKNATIDFKVEKRWINENNITSVSLARYESGWKKLKTEMINQTVLQNIYRAYTDGFSYFAIVGEKAQAAMQPLKNITEQPNATPSKPSAQTSDINFGIAAVLAIAIGLLFAGVYETRKKAKTKKNAKQH